MGGVTVVTAANGLGSDNSPVELLFAIDNRNETLLIYGVESQVEKRMLLLGGASLPALFRAARGG